MLLLLLSLACRTKDVYDTAGVVGQDPDNDGDGVAASEDCNDDDAAVFPGADELCNGVDDDCDGDTDEDALDATPWFNDGDGDGYGAGDALSACDQPIGYVLDEGDCDDANTAYHPGADESDCTDPNDYNCDGSVGYADADADGYPACEDCNDGDAAVNPDADEVCDGQDNDCDGTSDNDDALDALAWYADVDVDTYGDAAVSTTACEQPEGYVEDATDCDDAVYEVNPGATEYCNDIDDDCDGDIDEDDANDALTWYADNDADGYGSSSVTQRACEQPSGYTTDDTDCDDHDDDINPGATELCNGDDDDCDGDTDEDDAADADTWYADDDTDGFGDAATSMTSCDQPTGYVDDDSDCDDTDSDENPDADEICDGDDDDCDGDIDEDDAIDVSTWYADSDSDGYGDAASSMEACDQPSGYVSDATDCDDTDGRTNPGAEEICLSTGAVDHDCDGTADNNSCVTVTEISAPTYTYVSSPTYPGACGLIGELSSSLNTHAVTNLSSFMSILDGTSSGLASSTEVDVDELDYSIRCGSSYFASPGNYTSSTNAWPSLSSTSNQGAARFRGYINVTCDDPLGVTLGLIGNDAVSLSIEGTTVMQNHWTDGQWKKFRYVSFPEPGLYAFEVQWSTNLSCTLDPLEVVTADGFVSGYGDYDTMCAYSSCTYGNNSAIPDFSIVDSDWLVQTTGGDQSSCIQCASSTDCATGETCNTAGLCE